MYAGVERRVTVVLLSDGGPMGGLEDVVQLDPEVLQTRAIFDAARSGLIECVSGARELIDLVEAQRLLDALKIARTLAAEAEDRVLIERSLLTSAAAGRRAATRRPAVGRVADATTENPGARAAQPRSLHETAARVASRGAAFVLVRAVLPAAAALAGAALARRLCQR
jgi:hypothetical protein